MEKEIKVEAETDNLCIYCKTNDIYFTKTKRCESIKCHNAYHVSLYHNKTNSFKKKRQLARRAAYLKIKNDKEKYQNLLNSRKEYYLNLTKEKKERVLQNARNKYYARKLEQTNNKAIP